MHPSTGIVRRQFLKTSVLGGLAALTAGRVPLSAPAAQPASTSFTSRVALTAGNDRAENTFRALKAFAEPVARAIGRRRVVIKPNNVATTIQLAATHADSLEGILEFLKSIGKLENVVIAESAADNAAMVGFDNYHYTQVATKYGVKLLDLDQQPFDLVQVFDEKDFRPHAVRMSRLLLDPESYLDLGRQMKTHDRVVATLSLKNIIFGAPIKDAGFTFTASRRPGSKTDKPIAHGSGFRGINYNLFALAQRMHPHLAVIDGYDGMEGNGPTQGTPVQHRVCVVSPDWLAADRVGVALMGIDFAKVGYLNFCADAGLGEADLKKIEVIGEPIARHVKPYKLSDNIQQQMIWMKPA